MESEGTDKLKPSPVEEEGATGSKLGDLGRGSREQTQGGSTGDDAKAGRKGSNDASVKEGGRR